MSDPGGRARNKWVKTASGRRKLIEAAALSGGVIIDGMMIRTCKATGETRLVPTRNCRSRVSRITGSTGKAADDERESDGLVVARKRGNARGAKEPCCG